MTATKKTLTNRKLLHAKSIIERGFMQGGLYTYDTKQEKQTYCALGAIGRAYQDDDDFNYEDIPAEDMVVLACIIDIDAVDELIENIKGHKASPIDFQTIVIDFNDANSTTKEDVVKAFEDGCKNYSKYIDRVKKVHEADLGYNDVLNQRRERNGVHTGNKTTLSWEYLD